MMLSDRYNSNERDVINLISDITDMKISLVDYVTSQHTTFDINDSQIEELADQFVIMHERSNIVINESEKACNDIILSTEEREKYKQQIQSLLSLRTTVADLIDLDKSIRNFQEFKNAGLELSVDCLSNLSKELISLRKLLERSSFTIRVQDNKVYQTLIRSHLETKFDLITQVKELWNSKIVIERNGRNPFYDYGNPSKNENLVPISKSILFNMTTDVLRELICLMYNLDIGPERLLLVMTFITEELVYPFISNFKCYCLSMSTEDDTLLISLNSMLPDESLALEEQATQFMDSVTELLQVLYTDILSIAHNDTQSEFLMCEIEKTMLGDRFVDALISDFMPQLFDVHTELSNRFRQFNDTLVQYRCISRDNVRLSKYISNFQYYIREHEGTMQLTHCRRLCLQSMLKYEKKQGNIYQFFEGLWSDDITDECNELSKFIDVTSVAFPICYVSCIASEMMMYVGTSVIDYQWARDDQERAMDFIRTLPDIISLYLSVVPISNHRELENIPQAATLHYNNCMFIAHHCMVISPCIKNLVKIFTSTNDSDKIAVYNAPNSIVKLVYMLRDAASETLTNECNKQKEQLQEFFDGVDTFVGIGNKVHRAKIEKMLKQCSMHLSLLSQAYSVLPATIYNSFFMGVVMNQALALVVTRVVGMEDIVETDNREIVSLITNWCHSLVDVIKDHHRVDDPIDSASDRTTNTIVIEAYMLEHLPNWNKIHSLLFVLKTSLVEIEDRYAEGKGPLAEVFTGSELRSLVRALFRASQMRSRVLDKIN